MADLSKVLSAECMRKNFIPVLKEMSKDKIPNIRLNVAKTIWQMRKSEKKDNNLESDILQILNELKTDEDDDVKFYTKKAIVLK